MGYFLFALNMVLQMTGQIMLKTGMNAANGDWLKALMNPYVISGGAILAVNLLIWLAVLRFFQLSYIYPMGAFLYVLIAVGGLFFLHEHLTLLQWGGVGLIVLGVVALNIPVR